MKAIDRSHALRGNASTDALRSALQGRGASRAACPRRAWERSCATEPSHPAHATGDWASSPRPPIPTATPPR
ncbi:hypothetical protein B0E42_06300 [Pseudomonas sp. A25(2017)]|nr:hypothetical protein B0E42_06300 [Pseudomonas sp. A25(2017)]